MPQSLEARDSRRNVFGLFVCGLRLGVRLRRNEGHSVGLEAEARGAPPGLNLSSS